MNFDFIKDLEGLCMAYNSCENAEELAKSMPDLSMVASRKSAEVIAKFVYLMAHSESVEELTFADILSDYVVKDYLRNRSVIDAFHFVRKNGNTAVHTLTQESPDVAIAVLEKLHYAVGEVAKRMRLITNYPQFNADLAENTDAVLLEIDEAGKLAQEMYEDYIVSQNRADKFLTEFEYLCEPIQLIPGDVDLNETIEFKNKPALRSTIAKIQEHFSFLALQALKNLREENPEEKLNFDAEITIYGKNGFTSSGLIGFINALKYEIPDADGFKIVSTYYGKSIAPWFSHEVREVFSTEVANMGKQESFTYTIFEFIYNHGQGWCGKYENGSWIDLKSQYSPAIIDKEYPKDWLCWNLYLGVSFDFEKHLEILRKLQACVKKHVPEDQFEYCKQRWDDDEPQLLIDGIQWITKKLSPVQDFLDEVNGIIEPIKTECECGAEGHWYYTESPFAVATWDWTDDGFKVVGTEV